MNAAERLREALENAVIRDRRDDLWSSRRHETDRTLRIAVSERLAQLEADPELVERITDLLWGTFGDVVPLSHDETAKKILAAISTPTPVEES